ncbi:hypothetical protein OM948_08710 [Xanthomonas citri pv. fuscans]|uniref:hypothetical protein n=1 Tax=Xanthomonas citri TaxID=346 RepID=UPI0022267AD2|nr:hypothetical protein [Xanthomonas citri]UZB05517.1 hypothetical protein OM948_08710 [Xanthomonas citri pv. fuscans]
MRSDDNLDVFRDSPATRAAQWRQAAQSCAEQFPGDAKRLRYYESHAEMFEAELGLCYQTATAQGS